MLCSVVCHPSWFSSLHSVVFRAFLAFVDPSELVHLAINTPYNTRNRTEGLCVPIADTDSRDIVGGIPVNSIVFQSDLVVDLGIR